MATESFFNVSTFRDKLSGGAKPNLFQMSLTPPAAIDLDQQAGADWSILCKAGAIPSFTVGVIEVPFRGRRIKVPGDRTYAEWTATIVNDGDQKIRKFFDNWLKYINNPNGAEDIRTTGNDDYRTVIEIAHMKTNGRTSRVYQLVDAFPTDVSAIDVSYDTTDAIQEFTVTFQYHYVTVGDTVDADGDASPSPDATAGALA